MFQLSVTDTFAAAHKLEGYAGKCRNLHGHEWKVKATWKKSTLNDIGIALDFKELKDELKKILMRFDHTYLNKQLIKPTAENIARYIARALAREEKFGKYFYSCKVWETPTSCVCYKWIPAEERKQNVYPEKYIDTNTESNTNTESE